MLAADPKPTDGQAAVQAAANPSVAPKSSDSPPPQQQQASDAKTQPAEQNGAAEQKPGDAKVDLTKAEAKVEPKKPNAPDKYDFKAEKGLEFDAPVLQAYSDVARELDLSQEAAQKVLDKVAPVLHQRQVERVQEIRAEWTKASESDAEFGGDRFPMTQKVVDQAVAQFGDPELVQLLAETGLRTHPAVVRMFRKVGLSVGEDAIATGGPPVGELGLAQRLNPSMK